jgi:hypothetical protein
MRVPSVAVWMSLVAGLVLGSAEKAAAQEVGVKGGFNSSNLSIIDDVEGEQQFFSHRPAFVGGLYGVKSLGSSGRFGIQAEGLLSMKGSNIEEEGDEGRVALTYLELPVLARFNLTTAQRVGVHVFTGPAFAFRLGASAKDEEGGGSDNIEEYIKPTDVGWTIGAGVNVGKAIIDIRYTHGLLDVGRGEAPPMKNQAISVMAGFRLR